MPDCTAYDLAYRPDSYWEPSSAPWGRIKGQLRRPEIRAALERGEEPDMPSNLLQDSIPLRLRDAIGSINPSLRGGEDLPDFIGKEVEIARFQTPLTVHAEVTSIRARCSGGRIRYRVADEYGTRYTIRPKTSKRPLTMGQLIDLINTADSGYEDGNGLIVSFWEHQIEYEFNEGDLLESVVVESDYYPQLGTWYEDLLGEWLESHRPRPSGA